MDEVNVECIGEHLALRLEWELFVWLKEEGKLIFGGFVAAAD